MMSSGWSGLGVPCCMIMDCSLQERVSELSLVPDLIAMPVSKEKFVMIIRALRQYNAHLAVREHEGATDLPHKHGEPWRLAEDMEEWSGIEVPKQMAYFA